MSDQLQAADARMSDDHHPARNRSRADVIAEDYVEDYLALDPILGTHVGDTSRDDRLPDLSPDGFSAREDLTRAALRAMRALRPVDDAERTAQESFVERLTVTLDQYDAKTPQCQISVISSEVHNLRMVFDLMATDTEQDWANVSARLAAIPDALDGYRNTLLTCAATGHVSAKRQLAAVTDQIAEWVGEAGTAGSFFHNVVAEAEVPDDLGAELAINADRARGAFAGFGQFLGSELLPRGRDRDAVGRESYEVESRYFLGAEVDLDETYAWGWEELRRLEDDMAAVSRRIVPEGGVEAAVAALDADPARVVEGKEAFRDWMQELADATIDQLADRHFDIPDPIRRIECCLAPTSDGAIYYTGPTEDFSRPGRMWWAVPAGVDSFSTWQEVTTVYHEGVPGHHLQVADAVYRRELHNRWVRTMCWVSGHGEGWALYAERLMDELGYLDDPGHRLGMLDAQRLRAARVIVDIGMHLELGIPSDNPFGFACGQRWTPELGLRFLREHCRLADPTIRFEHLRYLGWPGQAPSYKVGERIWLQAREEVKTRHGAAFDLKRFHREALALGPLGLDPLRRALSRL